jgi:hypothetical protein
MVPLITLAVVVAVFAAEVAWIATAKTFRQVACPVPSALVPMHLGWR